MRLDFQTAIDMTDGVARRTIEGRDGSTEILPLVQLVAPVMRKTRPDPDPLVAQSESFLAYSEIARTNQAAVNTVLAILAPGVWNLEYSLASWFNFVNTAAAAKYTNIHAVFILPVSGLTMLAHYAAIGSQSTTGRVRLNLQNNTTIRMGSPLTGAAESLEMTAMLCGERIF